MNDFLNGPLVLAMISGIPINANGIEFTDLSAQERKDYLAAHSDEVLRNLAVDCRDLIFKIQCDLEDEHPIRKLQMDLMEPIVVSDEEMARIEKLNKDAGKEADELAKAEVIRHRNAALAQTQPKSH